MTNTARTPYRLDPPPVYDEYYLATQSDAIDDDQCANLPAAEPDLLAALVALVGCFSDSGATTVNRAVCEQS